MQRKDVEFKTEDDTTLRGWLYLPNDTGDVVPAIVMAHGYSAVKEMYLDKYGEVFAAAGMGALIFDNRNFGASDGEPRQEIDPWQQIRDYRDAITYTISLTMVDESRIGVFGSSYSGGHVLVVAGIDKRVKCVVSQVPIISGIENARRLIRSDLWDGLRGMFDDDRASRYAGNKPQMVPVVSSPYEQPQAPAALPTADSWKWFRETHDKLAPSWRNEVTLRSVEMFIEYEPAIYIPSISPTPLLMMIARDDVLTVSDLAFAAYDTAHEPKQLVVLNGGHFDAYIDSFDESSSSAKDWFSQYLLG